jgi:8-oxo-dGTP pyrophosphatase MutT (NUDIX family)
MQWKPNVVVAAIIRQGDRYLLVEERSGDGRLVLNQPAGHLEKDETLIDAVKREVLEETAWIFQPELLTGIYLRPDPASGITYLRFCFYGSCNTHDADRKLDDGIIRTLWMNREQMHAASDRMRSPLVIQCLQDYLSGQSYPLEILHSIAETYRP